MKKINFKYDEGVFFPEQNAHNLSKQDLKTVESFHNLYFKLLEKKSGLQISWLGHQTGKIPSDLWLYQELIYKEQPDVIIETGTHFGGSAVFLATICGLIGKGQVISIDLYPKENLPKCDRLTYLSGSSISNEIISKVDKITENKEKILVILDSNHTKDHVYQELILYSKYIKKGDLLIVEDTFLNGHPSHNDYGPGPTEAINLFLKENDEFKIDRSLEKFLLTLNYKGFLRKVI